VFLGDHVAEVDPDAKPDPPLLGRLGLAVSHPALQLHGAAHRINHALELRQEPVAGVLYDAAPVLSDLRIDQLSQVGFEPLVRPLLIRTH
jgi:hypothetical protein